jgi:hypothetical protein
MKSLTPLLQVLLNNALKTQESMMRANKRIAEANLLNAKNNQRLIDLLCNEVAKNRNPVKASVEPFLLRQMPSSQLN